MANYKRGLAVVVGSAVALIVCYAATYPRFHPQLAATAAAGAAAPPLTKAAALALSAELPLPLPSGAAADPLSWGRLTPEQQAALAPFATIWDSFSDARKRKWLKIVPRFQKMPPDAQKRLQERMSQWVGMTPDQRRLARENYQVAKDLPAQTKEKAWSAYQQLPESQKEKLAAAERRRRPTVVSAPPSGKRDRAITRLVDAASEALPVPPAPAPAKPISAVPPAASAAPVAPHSPTPAGTQPLYYNGG